MRNIVLNYHDFKGINESYEKSNYTLDFKVFKLQLDMLSDLVNLPILSLFDKSTESKLSYSLTFDDGYRSSLKIAEELYSRNLAGTFFIITDKLNDPKFLNKDEIKIMHSLGMEIGSHSCSHRHLNRLTVSELFMEMSDSKNILENIIGKEVKSIAFPGGMGGRREIKLALDIGYQICGLTKPSINETLKFSGNLNRFNIKDNLSLKGFYQLINLNDYDQLKLLVRYKTLALPKFIDSYLKHL